MTITALKPRLLSYLTAGTIAVIAGVIYKLSPNLNDSSLVILVVGVVLSTIMIYKLLLTADTDELSNKSPMAEGIDNLDQKNIRLALNFQGQGKLDAAYALYKQCKPSNKVVKLLTNLAEDYEIINQHDSARNVYAHILILQPDNSLAQSKAPSAKKNNKNSKPLSSAQSKTNTDTVECSLFNQRYEIIKNIGKGTGSTIFVAKDHHNDEQLTALKILEINYDEKNALETELLARFMREAETAASLEHKNIIQIIDSGHANNVAYIAMEFVRGKSLREYSQPKALLPHTLIVDLIAQCADGLHYAHEKGIIHRDVKPANILYDHAANCAKLGDFGIAHIANSTQTLAGSFLGTPFYMSPEQLSSLDVDARSDIFSLGATLYRLLTGVPPFSGNSMARLMHTIVNEPHQNILEIRPKLPKNLVDVVEIALAKEPNQRFANAAEFSQQLRQSL